MGERGRVKGSGEEARISSKKTTFLEKRRLELREKLYMRIWDKRRLILPRQTVKSKCR